MKTTKQALALALSLALAASTGSILVGCQQQDTTTSAEIAGETQEQEYGELGDAYAEMEFYYGDSDQATSTLSYIMSNTNEDDSTTALVNLLMSRSLSRDNIEQTEGVDQTKDGQYDSLINGYFFYSNVEEMGDSDFSYNDYPLTGNVWWWSEASGNPTDTISSFYMKSEHDADRVLSVTDETINDGAVLVTEMRDMEADELPTIQDIIQKYGNNYYIDNIGFSSGSAYYEITYVNETNPWVSIHFECYENGVIYAASYYDTSDSTNSVIYNYASIR